jgi:hypothetical protein
MLNMSRRKWNETISFKEIKYTHSKKFGDNANMVFEVKTILQMDAFSVKLVGSRIVCTLSYWDRFVIMWKEL